MSESNYSTLEKALKSIVPEDANFTITRHTYRKGEVVDAHFHPKATEWLIFNNGRMELTTDFSKKTIHAHARTKVIKLSAGYIHNMKALTPINYLVVRDKDDEIIYLDELMRSKVDLKPSRDICGIVWELHASQNVSVAYFDITDVAKEHMHKIMDETYHVVKGCGHLYLGRKNLTVSQGDTTKIPKNTWHHLEKTDNRLEVLVITHPKYMQSDVIER